MEKVQKSSNSVCYTLSSEPFLESVFHGGRRSPDLAIPGYGLAQNINSDVFVTYLSSFKCMRFRSALHLITSSRWGQEETKNKKRKMLTGLCLKGGEEEHLQSRVNALHLSVRPSVLQFRYRQCARVDFSHAETINRPS
jgi:hypothetical protein